MTDYRLIDVARANYGLVQALYERYLKDPKSISPEWINVFKTLELTPEKAAREIPVSPRIFPSGTEEYRIAFLIDAYRTWGHLLVPINPIAVAGPEEPDQLKLEYLGFTEADLPLEFPTCGLLKEEKAPLEKIIAVLKKIYCERIGFEYMGFHSLKLEKWIQDQIEPNALSLPFSIEQKKEILEQLNKAELFETFMHTKFTGQKRFSIEGGETFIPVMIAIIDKVADMGCDEIVMGMAHRGRLNVLANILNKSYSDIFSEFDEGYFQDSFEGSGDVKYHKGFLSEAVTFHGHKVRLTLTPNPSHLESVNSVVEGQVKAIQIKKNDEKKEKVLALLVHGDAAISGQGVVYETMQLYNLKGYSTGGTVHVVINNQIGFTTLPVDERSTHYCTDIAKTFGSPVFHVNAEDPEACVYAALLAAQIRQIFHIDVFIDLNSYRKWGHNEGDEPFFTQPIEYRLIRSKKSIREIYHQKLLDEGVIEKETIQKIEEEFKKDLQEAQKAIKTAKKNTEFSPPPSNSKIFKPIETGVSKNLLKEIAKQFCSIPENFQIHPKLANLLKERLAMVVTEEKPLDWGMGEIMAYATLLWEGTPLRLSGQDVGRGTFSHRHALLMDQATDLAYFPLSHLKPDQARSDVINSPLSEFAVLGFEYGYSTAYPEALVIWEAQFGDFGNGGQVIIDQYISASEQKWGQKSNLCLFLPHGYEGQGPEHSSARLERYLSLSGNDNWFVTYPTTPAQFFHLIRRQIFSGSPKPLVCMTPKQLLRYPLCVSPLDQFEKGAFQEILDDPKGSKNATRLLFCSGKIYYELINLREKEKLEDIAIIRIEQLYPLYVERIAEIMKQYKNAKEFIWVQEEPSNMGAWNYIHPLLEALLPPKAELEYIGRPPHASPATGSYALHKKEHEAILQAITAHQKGSIIEIAHFHRK